MWWPLETSIQTRIQRISSGQLRLYHWYEDFIEISNDEHAVFDTFVSWNQKTNDEPVYVNDESYNFVPDIPIPAESINEEEMTTSAATMEAGNILGCSLRGIVYSLLSMLEEQALGTIQGCNDVTMALRKEQNQVSIVLLRPGHEGGTFQL